MPLLSTAHRIAYPTSVQYRTLHSTPDLSTAVTTAARSLSLDAVPLVPQHRTLHTRRYSILHASKLSPSAPHSAQQTAHSPYPQRRGRGWDVAVEEREKERARRCRYGWLVLGGWFSDADLARQRREQHLVQRLRAGAPSVGESKATKKKTT
eukprot:3397114-Rhodomonas_salina.1